MKELLSTVRFNMHTLGQFSSKEIKERKKQLQLYNKQKWVGKTVLLKVFN